MQYRTSSDSGEPPGSTFVPLTTVGRLQSTILRLVSVGSHQGPLLYLLCQWGATSVPYLTSMYTWEQLGSTILSLVTKEVARVHHLTSSDCGKTQMILILPLVTVLSHQGPIYYYLTSIGSGVLPGALIFPLVAVGSHKGPLSFL